MIVLLGGTGEATRIVFHALEAGGVGPARAVIEDPIPRAQLVRRRVKKLGPARVAGQLAFQTLAVPVLARASRARVREIMREHGLSDAPIPRERVSRVSSVNAPETVALLRELRPTVVVVNGTRIISRDVLAQVPATFVNIHAGITPTYRGVHGGYWALVERRPEACGVTVHLVDPGIDTGGVLAQAVIRPGPRDNFVTYPFLQLAAGAPLLVIVVKELAAGAPPRTLPHEGASALRSHPGLGQYLYYRLTRGVR